jgi:hypothetical protein
MTTSPAAATPLFLEDARSAPEELALAAHALLGEPPTPEQLPDLVDFYALEWVDAAGWTTVERLVAAGKLPESALAWSHEVRTGLWVVDSWQGDQVCLRDLATDEEIAVFAPGQEGELPRRSVLRARTIGLPVEGAQARRTFVGSPDVWDPMSVLARMDLLARWNETPEPATLARLRALRAAFRRQREEREVFVRHFGEDLVVFDSPADMERRFADFMNELLNAARLPSLGGRTRAEAHRTTKGEDPVIARFELGGDLAAPGRHGIIYDAVEGVHFLPDLGAVLAHLRGTAEAPDPVRRYLADPGVTRLPFQRAGATAALAALLGVPDAPLDTLLAQPKPSGRRIAPSVLPSFDD